MLIPRLSQNQSIKLIEKFLPANGDGLAKEIFLQELFLSFQALVLRLNG